MGIRQLITTTSWYPNDLQDNRYMTARYYYFMHVLTTSCYPMPRYPFWGILDNECFRAQFSIPYSRKVWWTLNLTNWLSVGIWRNLKLAIWILSAIDVRAIIYIGEFLIWRSLPNLPNCQTSPKFPAIQYTISIYSVTKWWKVRGSMPPQSPSQNDAYAKWHWCMCVWLWFNIVNYLHHIKIILCW